MALAYDQVARFFQGGKTPEEQKTQEWLDYVHNPELPPKHTISVLLKACY